MQRSIRAGLSHRYETYEDPATDNLASFGLDFGLDFKHSLGEWGDWYTTLSYTPSFEDTGDYVISHESGISIPFNVQKDMKLSLKTGVETTTTLSQPLIVKLSIQSTFLDCHWTFNLDYPASADLYLRRLKIELCE